MRGRGWFRSLHGRGVLSALVGSGAVLGAVAVHTALSVETSIDRLLDERVERARTAGSYVEHHLRSDLLRLQDAGGPSLARCLAGGGGSACVEVRAALAARYRRTVFNEGVFVLDLAGRPLTAVPDRPEALAASFDLTELARVAAARRLSTTPILPLSGGPRQVLVVLAPVLSDSDHLLGFVGGMLQPAFTNVLQALALHGPTDTELDLIDSQGVVVSSTRPVSIFQAVDHDSLLAKAITNRRPLKSRCHSCHDKEARRTEILAFAPLPTLALGVAVRQDELAALAPAFDLERRMVWLGALLVCLFLLFMATSVQAVVRPLKRLTQAVRRVEETHDDLRLPSFGTDEAGELAEVLQRWHETMKVSLAEAEQSREALRAEVVASDRHLTAVQGLAESYAGGKSVGDVLRQGLATLLELTEFEVGTIRLKHGALEVSASHHASESMASALQRRCVFCEGEGEAGDHGQIGAAQCRTRVTDLADDPLGGVLQTVVAAGLEIPEGVMICCVLGDPRPGVPVDERWLESVMHPLVTSMASSLLGAEALAREALRRAYLGHVLHAREAERQWLARELHDTVAQNLTAHRLELERLLSLDPPAAIAQTLRSLEGQTQDIHVQLRGILLDLRLAVLEQMGLIPAVRAYLDRVAMLTNHTLRATLSTDGEEIEIDYDLSVNLYRILQECTQNVLQHARASHVFVTLATGAEVIELSVEDDGVGFDAEAVLSANPPRAYRGFGLVGIQERASLMGGTVEIVSKPGEGTTVRVVAPCHRPSENSA